LGSLFFPRMGVYVELIGNIPRRRSWACHGRLIHNLILTGCTNHCFH
jgi:hypothetical protein